MEKLVYWKNFQISQQLYTNTSVLKSSMYMRMNLDFIPRKPHKIKPVKLSSFYFEVTKFFSWVHLNWKSSFPGI